LSEYITTEDELAGNLGIDRRELAKSRKRVLQRKVDWITDKGKVCLTEDATRKILADLGILGSERAQEPAPDSPVPPPSESPPELPEPILPVQILDLGPSQPQNTTIELVMEKTCRNRRIIICRKGEDPVRVRVRNSRNFRKGMKVKARLISADLYELVGRCPRFRGRW